MELRTDAELVREAGRGSESAFSELVARHKERAVKMACVMAGNFEDAKDISQEAFVKAWRALGRFRHQSKFSTWFYRILMNTAKDFLRKRGLKNFLVWRRMETMENFFENVRDRAALPGKGLQNEELGRAMGRAIQNLPEKQRWIFTLRFVEGLPLAEIAQTAAVSEGTVKASLHFAIQKFRREMKDHEF